MRNLGPAVVRHKMQTPLSSPRVLGVAGAPAALVLERAPGTPLAAKPDVVSLLRCRWAPGAAFAPAWAARVAAGVAAALAHLHGLGVRTNTPGAAHVAHEKHWSNFQPCESLEPAGLPGHGEGLGSSTAANGIGRELSASCLALHAKAGTKKGAFLLGQACSQQHAACTLHTGQHALLHEHYCSPHATRSVYHKSHCLRQASAGQVCHGDVYAHNVMADAAGATTLLDYGAAACFSLILALTASR